MIIYNIHTHIFTVKNVPNNFLPLGLNHILKPDIIRKPLSWIFRKAIPFTDRDFIERYVNFLKISSNKTQEDVFNILKGYYPQKGSDATKFVILPMDMRYMAAGKVPESVDTQHQGLATLRDKYPDTIIPFVAVDPRSVDDKNGDDPLAFAKKYIEVYKFKGIKLYPPLGYYPTDERLYPVYEYAEKNNIPMLSHCSRGGVHTKKVTKDMLKTHPWRPTPLKKSKAKVFSDYFTEPENYRQVLKDFPKLKICLAHFGGDIEWDKYLFESWDPNGSAEKSWLATIVDLMKEFPNLYTDISSTLFKTEEYFPLLNVLLEDSKINKQILFGSDYYMVERDKLRERDMSIRIRANLGPAKFKLIANDNPVKFLELPAK
ncbi:MAG: amidohydrolase family protein [Cyclobacteriaceae bacterium]